MAYLAEPIANFSSHNLSGVSEYYVYQNDELTLPHLVFFFCAFFVLSSEMNP